ncbi:MAG: serine protein kinase RIO [Methylophilaceae bacterium]|nr:serine protein kinase RIO [Methylophilaceae bacterium]
MKTPPRLLALQEDGLIDEVTRQLMSGKEATVFVVRSGDEVMCAKVYKEANKRSFRQSVDYTEGRKVKNSRLARAMNKGSKYGKQAQEEAWQSAEVDALYRLADAGVTVPKPYNFYEGVLLMELVTDEHGHAAPRLNDLSFTAEEARLHHNSLVTEVVRMLCAGIVHGDLSEFNILLGENGPVIIDLPQAVDASSNNHAQAMLYRDVNNLAIFFGQFAPELRNTQYGKEIWGLYAKGALSLDVTLTGRTKENHKAVDLNSIVHEIDATRAQEERRKQRMLDA